MSDIARELEEQLTPILRSGDLAKCEQIAAARLAGLARSPFHIVLDLQITTNPKELAAAFDKFFEQESTRFKIAAAYTEMNGFYINPGLWYCTPFAYERYGGHDDYNWLADWQSETGESVVIEGLERLQAVYASEAFQDQQLKDARRVTDLMVVLRFQDLIRRAAPHMKNLHFPLLATAHDYDFIDEIRRVEVGHAPRA